MSVKPWLLLSAVVAAVCAAVVWAAQSPVLQNEPAAPVAGADGIRESATALDAAMEARWKRDNLLPAKPADELMVLRRMSLALQGTVPSLEEVREFESDRSPDRLLRWADRILRNKRFPDYFSERLSRAYVGVDTTPFLIFRRDRFRQWLAGELQKNSPYDQIVRDIVADRGLWTGTPASNFITSAVVNDDVDENKLAGRTVRAFLGQRMDCAQCHDHPFADWKQNQFEGLAAFFGQVRVTIAGVEDLREQRGEPLEYVVEDRQTTEKRTVAPMPPFHPEWMPTEGSRREQLAAWITHPDNRRFDRAIVNRVWGYLFGRPWHDPVDDLPNPPEGAEETPLDVAARDFRAHGRDLRRLILVLTSSRAFRLSSAHDEADVDQHQKLCDAWAVFPMTRLRPEQVIGSMLQAGSPRTIDQNSHLVTRIFRYFRERDFVEEYGDLGDTELIEQTATIPQALQRMNGELARDIVRANPLNATGRISSMAKDTSNLLEVCFLVTLSRRPTSEEAAALSGPFAGGSDDDRTQAVEDLIWALFNSEEFTWNH